jgi:hypothetical protein
LKEKLMTNTTTTITISSLDELGPAIERAVREMLTAAMEQAPRQFPGGQPNAARLVFDSQPSWMDKFLPAPTASPCHPLQANPSASPWEQMRANPSPDPREQAKAARAALYRLLARR